MLTFPNFYSDFFASPLSGHGVGGEPEVQLVTLNGATAIFHTPITVSWNKENGSKGERLISSDCSISSLCTHGGLSDSLALALVAACIDVRGPKKSEGRIPGILPAAADATVAIARNLHDFDNWLRGRRGRFETVMDASYEPKRCGKKDRQQADDVGTACRCLYGILFFVSLTQSETLFSMLRDNVQPEALRYSPCPQR